MRKYTDLHIHSTASDGSWAPEKIIERACRYELSAIALTDHDAVAGIDEAMHFASLRNLRFIPGIEISTSFCHGRLHILGYFIEHHSPAIDELLQKLQQSRRDRVYRTCEVLTEHKLPVTPELVFEIAGSADSVGRPHIARAMVRLGYVNTLQQAFDKYLSYGRFAYVRRWSPEPTIAIDMIHGANGLAVLAHCPVTEGCMDRLEEIATLDIDGVEAYYPNHHPQQIEFLKKFAGEHRLAFTGGSDCHGEMRGEPLLGIYKVPYEVVDSLDAKFEQRYGRKP